MKSITLIILLNISLFASEYFAKLQPLETYNIKASVSGQIVYVNDNIEGKTTNNTTILKIDNGIDKVELKQTLLKITTYKQIIKIEEGTLSKFQKIKSKSQMDRDNQKIKVLNLKNQLTDLITKKAMLEDKLTKKILIDNNHYISKINVKMGDFVNPGALLYIANDLSKAKLEIFLPISTANEQKNKTIYIDGVKTNYKINKLYKVSDSVHISSYKCEIIVDSQVHFSKLVKIEFK